MDYSSRRTVLALAAGVMAAVLGLLAPAGQAQTGESLIANGGFENGASGWMYQQWENKPLPGVIDKEQKTEGTASFKFGLGGASGGRWIAHEIKLPESGKDYILTFSAKGEKLPAAAVRMRAGIEGKGFFGSAAGKPDIMQEGGTFDWKKYEIRLSAAELGDATKITLFFYHDQVGQGTLWIDAVALRPVSTPIAASATPAEPENNTGNLIDNGGFEGGESGWMWQQWEGKPLPGAIDRSNRVRGAASFKMGLSGATGGRWLSKEIKLPKADTNYIFSFWLKPTDLAPDSAYVRLSIENKGWLGSASGKTDLIRVGDTGDWKQYSFPVSSSQVGDSAKATVFFYHDQIGQGTLGIDAVALKIATEKDLAVAGVSGDGPVLVGDTSHPVLSTFAMGEEVKLSFRATGLTAEAGTLQLQIVDEHDQLIQKQDIALKIEKGEAEATVVAPNQKLGFYRVKATLSDGTELKKLGSRKAGFITYAIVPNPKQRKNYGEMKSRFGMQGGFGPWGDQSLAYLGARWVLDGSFEWKRNEPDRAGQFAEDIAAGKFGRPEKTSAWQTFSLPTLMGVPQWAVVPGTAPYMTGVLTPEGEKAWADYCRLAVEQYARQNPSREERIYQVTWEPVYPWGFKGRNEDLIRIYEIAYPVIHEADPKAVVAGPTNGVRDGEIEVQTTQLQMGLGKYLDMYSAHPYYDIEAEKAGLPRELRRIRRALEQYSGKKNMPMIGTEQGYTTEELVEKELIQARGLLRQNLIMLGEGWRFNFTYYIVDYLLGEQKGYGYYYNLVDGVPWAPAKASPRPVVPAYAAQSLLLDGSDSLGAIEWFGATAWGYAFARDGQITLALWDYGDEKREVSLPAGVRQVKVYDWMGNGGDVQCPMGSLQVTLSPEPIYIVGVSPHIWGPAESRMLSVDRDEIRVFPGDRAEVTGVIRTASEAFSGEIVVEGAGLPRLSKPVIVSAGQNAKFSFEVLIPGDLSPASVPLAVMLVADQSQVAGAGSRLKVQSPLAFVSMVPTFENGTFGVKLDLRDEKGEGFSGDIALQMAGLASQQVHVTVPAGKSSQVTVPLSGATIPGSKITTLTAEAKSANGAMMSHKWPVNFMAAQHSLGGKGLERSTAVHLSGREMVVRSPEFFQETLAAGFRYGWDSDALYIEATVSDPVHHQPHSGVQTWRADCLQLAFNLDPMLSENKTANVLDTNVRRATEINVALTSAGVEAFRAVSYDAANLPTELLSKEQLAAAVAREGQQTVYRIAIPWKTLGATEPPTAEQVIGIAATVNDSNSDEQKAPTALGLFGGIVPAKDSGKFGQLILAR